MGCCTNLAHFCKQIGVDRLIEPQKTLYFMTPDGRVSRFGSVLRLVQNGYLYSYAFWMMIGLALLLGWFLMHFFHV